MPFTIPALVAAARDPVALRQAYAEAAGLVPEFPQDGCAAVCSGLLRLAGFAVPTMLVAESLAQRLRHYNWSRIDRDAPPQSGDVFVAVDLDGNGLADHIGVVADLADVGYFMATDNQLDGHDMAPYRRNIFPPPGKTPVDYWLRWSGVTFPPAPTP